MGSNPTGSKDRGLMAGHHFHYVFVASFFKDFEELKSVVVQSYFVVNHKDTGSNPVCGKQALQ